MDRAATTWSVLNGVSFNCVQCHSHPYDPIRHVEYYKFLAFFNTSRDADMAFDASLPDDWPVLRVPAEQRNYDQALKLQEEIAALRQNVVDASRTAAQNSRYFVPNRTANFLVGPRAIRVMPQSMDRKKW